MVEASNPFSPFNPFDVEVLMLLKEEAETSEKRLNAKLVKDVKVEPNNVSNPLVTKPVWPYVLWSTNYVDNPAEFNLQATRHGLGLPLSCSSENIETGQMSKRDDSSSLDATDSSESKLVCENEVDPNPEVVSAGTETLSVEGITESLQRSINLLSDLQELLSIGVEKYFSSDIGRNETESDQSRATLQNIGEEISKLVAVGKETLQFPYDDDERISHDVGLNESSEKSPAFSQNELYREENIEKETDEPNLKSSPKSVKCEDMLKTKMPDTGQSQSERDGAVFTLSDAFDYKEGSADSGGSSRSQETVVTDSGREIPEIVQHKKNQSQIEDLEEDLRVASVGKAPEQGEKIPSISKEDHFKTELQSGVSTKSVLYKTIGKWLPSIGIDRLVKTEPIKELVRSLMSNTVQELQTKHHIFSKCYIIETGSMAEGTKIGQPDEFDFTIVLPMLADSDVAELFFIKLGMQARLHNNIRDEVLSFLCQFPFVDPSYRHCLLNAQFLQVFRETVRKHLPHGWAMREESDGHMMRVFLKNQTLTFHLQCESGIDLGFILSIDVCFGIPLDAERLQTVYVSDHTHALHLTAIQNECLRLNTGVVSVISENPLFGGRFFYQTEPFKFHGNKLAADCYRLAKHVARSFLPKVNKNNCSLCEDTLIPSFYMKTVMFFMMDFYTETTDWSDTQLGNRLIEIFEIISHGFLHQYKALAYYGYINSMRLDFRMKYSPVNGIVEAGVGMDREKPCTIPPMEGLNLASPHEDVVTAVKNYWKYMQYEEWTVGDLLQKLIELLYALKFTEID